jgi:ubiquinone biosynthesis protein UbiJ
MDRPGIGWAFIRQNRVRMNTTSPFSFLQSLLEAAASQVQPPQWLADEARHRLLLLINHVLMQEPAAQARLARRHGSVIHVRWGLIELLLLITPAGLFDRAEALRHPDLVLSLDGHRPLQVVRLVLEGERPPVQIEGDVQLAAEVAWLAENLRWDLEEDLARVLGDVPAHALADAAGRILQALRPFLARATNPTPAAAGHGLGARA